MILNQSYVDKSILSISFPVDNQFSDFISVCRSTKSMAVKVSGGRKTSGMVVVEIYKEKLNWLKTPFRLVMPLDEQISTFSFSVPYVKYAITGYLELNENGKLDMNISGIPKEPVGFRNN